MPKSSRPSLPPRKRGEGKYWIPADAGMTKPDFSGQLIHDPRPFKDSR